MYDDGASFQLTGRGTTRTVGRRTATVSLSTIRRMIPCGVLNNRLAPISSGSLTPTYVHGRVDEI